MSIWCAGVELLTFSKDSKCALGHPEMPKGPGMFPRIRNVSHRPWRDNVTSDIIHLSMCRTC